MALVRISRRRGSWCRPVGRDRMGCAL